MAESLHILLGTSACLQWLCHSGERTVARGPLVFLFACLCKITKMLLLSTLTLYLLVCLTCCIYLSEKYSYHQS